MFKTYSNYSTNICHVASSVTWYCNHSWHNLEVSLRDWRRQRKEDASVDVSPTQKREGTEKAVNPASLNSGKWPCFSNLDTGSLVFFPLSLSIWNILASGKRTLNLCDSFGTHTKWQIQEEKTTVPMWTRQKHYFGMIRYCDSKQLLSSKQCNNYGVTYIYIMFEWEK